MSLKGVNRLVVFINQECPDEFQADHHPIGQTKRRPSPQQADKENIGFPDATTGQRI